MEYLDNEINKTKKKLQKNKNLDTPEIKSALVQISHKIPSNNSRGIIIQIKGQYYRIKELG